MILKRLIRNEWLETRRSSIWEQSLGVRIFLGILFFILFLEFLLGSIFFSSGFHKIFPDDDPVQLFNSYVLYGFALGFVTRFLIQKVPVLSVQPYLHLPVKRAVLVHYVLGKSLFSFFNFIPIVVFIPFVLFQIAPWYSATAIIAYFLTIGFSVLTVNFLSLLFKRNFSFNNWIAGLLALLLVGLAFLDFYGFISIRDFSAQLFTAALENPVWLLIPLATFLLAYLANYYSLIGQLYPAERKRRKQESRKKDSEFSYLKNFGETGRLIQLELKLLVRNKRPKTSVYVLPIFLLYGFVFYPQEIYLEMTGMLIFVGVFMTGPALMIYGQYILSWESSYFDGILTHIDDFHKYFRAKYYIMVFSTLAAFIVTMPYAFYGWRVLWINLACAMFNIGLGPVYVLLMSSNNKKRLDLAQGASFNYQGMSATQLLISFPILLAPLFIYLPFWAFGNPFAGVIAIGITGLIAFTFNKYFINLAVNRFLGLRYEMAEGFRQKY